MHLLSLITAIAPLAVHAINGRCSGSGKWYDYGICITTSTCNSYRGTYTNNRCPNDPDNVKCCVIEPVPGPCAANSFCDWRGSGTDCAGSYKPGYCPGPSNFECCDIFG